MRVPEQPKSAEVELIRGLEEQLLRPEVRTSPELVAALLADEFTEIGSSGRVYNKQQIIDRLQRERWSGPQATVRDFSARLLAADLIFVTYSIIESQTIRSSIWKLTDGRWQIVFHQGTRSSAITEPRKANATAQRASLRRPATITPVVFLETDPIRKRELQRRLTAQLPEWFGRPDANAEYARQAEVLDGYVAEIDHDPCGLLLLKRSSPISAEIYWIGVDPKFHGRGIGRSLVTAASAAAHKRGVKFLFVATLHPDDPYEPYRRTRGFYEALGFVYVLEERFTADPNNRIGYYMKDINA